ncbi:PilW family protein [Thalassotalea euphylliae]|uniref:PilW family protein n=1 Tax=Thalassotalea euphylliae TaxID=1655234 RepID=UPI00364279F0
MTRLNKGFTLLEMVTVIVLLGVVSVGIGAIINLGSRTYVDVTTRDELIGGARFAVERMNREIRSALPNSLKDTSIGNSKCIEFRPIVTSFVYTDAPIDPEVGDSITVVNFDERTIANAASLVAVIYPLDWEQLADRQANIEGFSRVAGFEYVLDLPTGSQFAEGSPTDRVFIVEPNDISYCIVGEQLTRSVGGGSAVLMAEYIDSNNSSFEVIKPTLQRNGAVLVKLAFKQNFEEVRFSNEVQVINVP